MQNRVEECVRSMTVAMTEKEHEYKLNQLNKMSYPVINRAASKNILHERLHKQFDGNEKIFEGMKVSMQDLT